MNTILFNMLLMSAVTVGTLSLSAQTDQKPLITVEGEDFIASGFNGGSGTGSSAEPRIESDFEGASGGKHVRGLSKSNTVLYNFYVETEGVYKLVIRYNCAKDEAAFQAPFMTTRINDQVKVGPIDVPLTPNDAEDKPTFGNFEQLVYCNAGWNRLVIGGGANEKYNARIDKWELYTSDEAYAKPETDTSAPYATSDASYDNGVEVYKHGMEVFAKTISLVNDNGNSTTNNLFDNDFSTEFVSVRDVETFILEFDAPIVLRQLVLGSLLRQGKMMVEYSLDGEAWVEWVKNESFTQQRNNTGGNGGTGTVNWWINPYAPFTDNVTTGKFFRITLNKAPGAPEIVMSEIGLYGNVYSSDLEIGTNKYKYMIDDLTSVENGKWESLVKPNGSSIQEETYGPYQEGTFGALDNAYSSKFSVPGKGFILTYEFKNVAKVNSYWLSSATSSKRFVKDLILQGSNDNETYVDLHAVTDLKQFHNYMLLPFEFENNNSYKYYRLNVTANNGDGGFTEIGDFLLFGESLPTSSDELTQVAAKVFVAEGEIHVHAYAGATVLVYNTYGQLLKSGSMAGEQSFLSVPAGIYLVTVDGITSKVVVSAR